MLDNFKEIYDKELVDCYYDGLERLILDSEIVRIFVYAVCKECIKNGKYRCICGALEGKPHKPICSVGNGVYRR